MIPFIIALFSLLIAMVLMLVIEINKLKSHIGYIERRLDIDDYCLKINGLYEYDYALKIEDVNER